MVEHRRDRRSDILTAAEAEFGEYGLAGGRIERIAASARVNKQLVFHYFESKEQLYLAVLEALLIRLEPPAGSGSPADELRQLLRLLEETSRKTPGLRTLLADDHPPARSWLSHLGERAASLIADGQRRGYFRDDIDPRSVAQVAVSAALWRAALTKDGQAAVVDALILEYCTWR